MEFQFRCPWGIHPLLAIFLIAVQVVPEETQWTCMPQKCDVIAGHCLAHLFVFVLPRTYATHTRCGCRPFSCPSFCLALSCSGRDEMFGQAQLRLFHWAAGIHRVSSYCTRGLLFLFMRLPCVKCLLCVECRGAVFCSFEICLKCIELFSIYLTCVVYCFDLISNDLTCFLNAFHLFF